jgi:hypothetical protein
MNIPVKIVIFAIAVFLGAAAGIALFTAPIYLYAIILSLSGSGTDEIPIAPYLTWIVMIGGPVLGAIFGIVGSCHYVAAFELWTRRRMFLSSGYKSYRRYSFPVPPISQPRRSG